jgi:hypothetical protein
MMSTSHCLNAEAQLLVRTPHDHCAITVQFDIGRIFDSTYFRWYLPKPHEGRLAGYLPAPIAPKSHKILGIATGYGGPSSSPSSQRLCCGLQSFSVKLHFAGSMGVSFFVRRSINLLMIVAQVGRTRTSRLRWCCQLNISVSQTVSQYITSTMSYRLSKSSRTGRSIYDVMVRGLWGANNLWMHKDIFQSASEHF